MIDELDLSTQGRVMGETARGLVRVLSAAQHEIDKKEEYKEYIENAKNFFERVQLYKEGLKSNTLKNLDKLNELESRFFLRYLNDSQQIQKLTTILNNFSEELNPKKEELEELTKFYDLQLEYSLKYFGNFKEI